jgi:hypothetical protein
MTTAEMRRFAFDLISAWAGSPMADKAKTHGERMIAQADLEDAQSGREPEIAEIAIVEQNLPIVGKVTIKGGKRISIEYPYNGEAESQEIHTAWEWRDDPSSEDRTGMLCRLYIGTKSAGPVAMYDADSGIWSELKSKGNFGKKYACGGNFSSHRISGIPEIVSKITLVKPDKVAIAQAKLAAANKRVLAAHQRENASAYMRQASNPAYEGQEMICTGKANTALAHAARTEAEADLIEAKVI